MDFKLIWITLSLVAITSVSSTAIKSTATKPVQQKRNIYGFEMYGENKFRYKTLSVTRFGQFDFGQADLCDCDCGAEAGDLQAIEINNKRKAAIAKIPKSPPQSTEDGRPLFTSVSEALKFMKNEPEEKRVRFLYAIMDDIDNESQVVCRCCQNWNLLGAELDQYD